MLKKPNFYDYHSRHTIHLRKKRELNHQYCIHIVIRRKRLECLAIPLLYNPSTPKCTMNLKNSFPYLFLKRGKLIRINIKRKMRETIDIIVHAKQIIINIMTSFFYKETYQQHVIGWVSQPLSLECATKVMTSISHGV